MAARIIHTPRLAEESKLDPLCSVVVVHHNTPKHLEQLIKQLTSDSTLQVIAVDNFSSEEVTTHVRQITDQVADRQNVLIITNHDNRGFAAACNQAAAYAKAPWILFLNPDVDIKPPRIHQMIDEATRGNFDAVSPYPESDNYRKPIPSPLSLLCEFTPLKYFTTPAMFSQKTLIGGCLMIKKDVLTRIKGWDEQFFLWFEDSDLTRRLINAKYHVGWVDVEHMHIGGASLKKLTKKDQRLIFFTSMQLYANKHFGKVGQWITDRIAKKYLKENV